MPKLKTTLASLAATLALSGCMTAPHKAYTVGQAKTAPVRNLTNMDLALGCLDRLLVEYQVRPMYITSPGLPNRADDKLGLSSSADMLKTSIGQLSQSNVFRYVDLSFLAMSQYGGNANETGSRPLDANAIHTWIEFLRLYISLEVGLIDLLVFSVGAAHGRERLRAMGGARDRGHGPLLQFNQLNPLPISFGVFLSQTPNSGDSRRLPRRLRL